LRSNIKEDSELINYMNNEDVVSRLKAAASDEEIAALHKVRREKIKTILIVFLILLLLLTFFSNTIMNRSLPEIKTQQTFSGNLTEKFRGSGTAEANQSYEVTVKDNKTVEKIYVKRGAAIAKGDVLFTLTSEDSPELKDAQEILKTLEEAYQTALLKAPANYSSENMQIRNCREDLQKLVNQRNKVSNSASQTASLKTKRQEYKKELDIKTPKFSKLMEYIGYIDANNFIFLPSEYSGSLASLNATVTSAQTAFDNAEAYLMQLINIGASDEAISAAQADVNTKQTALQSATTALNNEKNRLKTSIASEYNSLDARITELNMLISDIDEQLLAGDMTDVSMLDEQITMKQRELESLLIAIEATKQNDNLAQKAENISLSSQRDKVQEQRDKVNKLLETAETVDVLSDYDGVVGDIFVKPKDMTVPDMPLASIVLAEEGYTMQIAVDVKKTAKLSTGTVADVMNNWMNDITVRLESIKPDPQGGSKSRLLIFNVAGNVSAGQYLDVSIPCGTGRYDVIVPKSAVYEDNDGKFVLTMRTKETPLGNRYYADRVNVEILAEDEVSCAIAGGNLYTGSYVITTSSKPIKPGDQVRMKDK